MHIKKSNLFFIYFILYRKDDEERRNEQIKKELENYENELKQDLEKKRSSRFRTSWFTKKRRRKCPRIRRN